MEVFIAGATGYLGSRLAARLISRNHQVRALARASSANRVPAGCQTVPGNALDAQSFAAAVPGSDAYVHLVGAAHPAPWKGPQFRAIDQPSLLASLEAAAQAGVRHFVYVSVAHPAPLMQAYIEVRQECETAIRAAGLSATILRPWYVVGPGHWWPVLLIPAYKLMEAMPSTREHALRLGLVRLNQMLDALVWAVENPPPGIRILDVPAIRSAR
ncbi:MAG: NAD(P)H-binding protein [Acidobacteria bacterium]|nr:NAD(P)H-binding protein [Acidobacteriota bacterium]